MQPNSIWYQGYDREEFDTLTVYQERHDGSSRSGLSTFQIPVSIRIEIRGATYIAFVFIYPNDEPAEKYLHELIDDSKVQFLFGAKTLKILEVRYLDAMPRLREKSLVFDPNKVRRDIDLHEYEQQTSFMNAVLIANIMERLPSGLIHEIRAQLRQFSEEKGQGQGVQG